MNLHLSHKIIINSWLKVFKNVRTKFVWNKFLELLFKNKNCTLIHKCLSQVMSHFDFRGGEYNNIIEFGQNSKFLCLFIHLNEFSNLFYFDSKFEIAKQIEQNLTALKWIEIVAIQNISYTFLQSTGTFVWLGKVRTQFNLKKEIQSAIKYPRNHFIDKSTSFYSWHIHVCFRIKLK